ncbi:MAG: rod shape-determining protein RodA [Candidatus Omnitrophica bacterium]|nr:rod shape-determining protein RodA [Candidatus Omnitrophota bacterium]
MIFALPRIRWTPLKMLCLCLLFLNIVGLLSLFSSLHQGGEFRGHEVFLKQISWLAISWGLLVLFSFINYRIYHDFAFILYLLNIALLITVIVAGKKAMGAQRWLSVGGITFQPSELAKAVTILLLARCFTAAKHSVFSRSFLFPLGLVALNALLIFKQPDLGTALILLLLFLLMGFASPVKKKYFIILLLIGLLSVPFAWGMLKDYQQKRLIVFLDPNVDPLGAGYTIIQSKVAIGSGQFTGKGFLSGTQNQFNFLPERHTDFIFTVVAEEWGFLGALLLLFVYWLILRKLLEIAHTTKDPYAYMVVAGIASLFFLHVFINIGMTCGILPVVGLPLFFMSYGGSHLVVSSILTGIAFNIWRRTS